MPAIVEVVPEGSWAARAGVRPGDTLVAVNGRAVSSMSGSEFSACFLLGPRAVLTFAHAGDGSSAPHVDEPQQANEEVKADERPAAKAPRRRRRPSIQQHGYRRSLKLEEVHAATPSRRSSASSWAEVVAIPDPSRSSPSEPGDVPEAGSDRSSSLRADSSHWSDSAGAPEQRWAVLEDSDEAEELSCTETRSSWWSDSAALSELGAPGRDGEDLFAAIAEPGQEKLGFQVSEPFRPFVVTRVAVDGWAARSGVGVGDELAEVNGWGVHRKVEEMTKQEFDICMSTIRPLRLVFMPAPADGRGALDRPLEAEEDASSSGTAPSGIVTEASSFAVVAGAGEGSLGFRAKRQRRPLRVAAVVAGSWAELAGVGVGDELCEVRAWGVNRKASLLTSREFALCASSIRPLQLLFARAARSGEAAELGTT